MFTDRLLNGFYKDIWDKETPYKDLNQLEMEFLWPHRGIQLSLDLDTEGCDTRQKLYAGPANYSFGTCNVPLGVGMTTINSTLSVSPTNSVGELSIGGVNIGIEKKPSVLQKVLYKLLGFKWSERPEK
jgi:hypothetical protein